MSDFQNGKIYKLYSVEADLTYYGSTTTTLATRLARHIMHKVSFENGDGRSCYSRFVLACPDYKMELVEDFPCNSKKELKTREQYYLDNFPNCNFQAAILTPEQREEKKKEYGQRWWKKNKEKAKEYKERNKEDPEKKKARRKKYYEEHKEREKVRATEWMQTNKEKVNAKRRANYNPEKSKVDYEKNKEKILARKREKVECEMCGKLLSRSCLSRHKRTIHK